MKIASRSQRISDVYVIPGSNQNRERSFSIAYRLSREFRKCFSPFFNMQRDGRSLLAVRPEYQTYKWTPP
ncbi:hypothetical protein Y032_0259g489 [Ancylostoma ceylanicum]|uniref:Uncharacterized protein n=1 Tax=Ancylostoma ceylanicum TaxID=53326 RepID=A0A016SAJ7_9BILA|nr:hypothetical protein Y032_0259g489 [Ancylostoma ceylanicum]